MTFLDVENLHVEAGEKSILRGVSLNIKKGELHVLAGPNGSGKTSLACALAGHPAYQVRADSAIFDGADISGLKMHERAQRGIHWIPQSPPAFEGVGLLNLLRAAKRGAADIFSLRTDAVAALRRVGLPEEFLLRPLHRDASGGERKKTELALALVLRPRFLIADEVDAGLDAEGITAAVSILNELRRDAGILVITHSEDFIRRLGADRIWRIDEGKIV